MFATVLLSQGTGVTALSSGAFNILMGPLALGAHAIECRYGKDSRISSSGVSEVRIQLPIRNMS